MVPSHIPVDWMCNQHASVLWVILRLVWNYIHVPVFRQALWHLGCMLFCFPLLVKDVGKICLLAPKPGFSQSCHCIVNCKNRAYFNTARCSFWLLHNCHTEQTIIFHIWFIGQFVFSLLILLPFSFKVQDVEEYPSSNQQHHFDVEFFYMP